MTSPGAIDDNVFKKENVLNESLKLLLNQM